MRLLSHNNLYITLQDAPERTGYPRDNQCDREQQTLLTSVSGQREKILVWEQLATHQFDPWQVVPRQVFAICCCLLIPIAFVVVSGIGVLGVTGVLNILRTRPILCHFF